MSATTVFLNMDDERVVPVLQEATRGIDVHGDVVLDFSAVRRIDSGVLRALEEFARVAEQKAVKVVLRGVSIDVYKALKLAKLTRRCSFVD